MGLRRKENLVYFVNLSSYVLLLVKGGFLSGLTNTKGYTFGTFENVLSTHFLPGLVDKLLETNYQSTFLD